jgi:hypothetical protein
MATNRQLKIDLLKDQNNCLQLIHKILSKLLQVDAQASLLPVEKATASRILVKKLWEVLPEEHESCQFENVEEQTTKGRGYLPTNEFSQNVTLHLGWDVLSFSCTLEAAWQSWKDFNALNIDTFNCCIYPDSLGWYIIRAGNNLYPMSYSGEKYELRTIHGCL